MLSQAQLSAITDYLQSVPQLTGCRIGYYGGDMSTPLHPGNPGSPHYNIIVIIDEFNIRPYSSTGPDAEPELPTPAQVTNDSRVGRELIGAGLSCGFTIVAGVGFVGALAAEGPSLGTSTVLAVAAWTGMATGYAQCINGLYRSSEALANPYSDSLERLDNEAWYSGTFFVIDALGVISGGFGIAGSRRAIIQLLERRAALPVAQQLGQLSRAERIEAFRQALRRAAGNNQTRRELIAALEEAFPNRNVAAMILGRNPISSIRSGVVVSNIISEAIAGGISNEIRNIIMGLGGFAVSGSPASMTGSGSGSLNTIGAAVINILRSEQ